MIDGIPLSRPSRRWQAAHVAASSAPRSLSASALRFAANIAKLAAIESAMIWRILDALSSRKHLAVTRPASRRQRAWRMSIAAPSSTDHEVVCQRINAAAVLFPNKLEPTALCRAQVELNIGVGRHGLVQIDAEHAGVVVTTNKLVDDLARDHVALVITTQPGLHRMADQGFDLKYFALFCSAWHLHAWCRREHSRLPPGCQVQPLVATSTQVLVIRSAPSFISATARTYCGSARRIRVDTRGSLRRGTKWKVATSMSGFRGASTRAYLT